MPSAPDNVEQQKVLGKINADLNDSFDYGWLLLVGILPLFGLLAYPASIVLPVFFCAAIAVFMLFYYLQVHCKQVNLSWELSQEEEQRFRAMHDAVEALFDANSSWFIPRAVGPRAPLSAHPDLPASITSNLRIPGFDGGYIKVYFFPDYCIYLKGSTAHIVNYTELRAQSSTTLVQLTTRPDDAVVLRTTWKHTRKDGLPDGRYNDNPKIFICTIGQLALETPEGVIFRMQTSNPEVSEKAKELFDCFLSHSEDKSEAAMNASDSAPPPLPCSPHAAATEESSIVLQQMLSEAIEGLRAQAGNLLDTVQRKVITCRETQSLPPVLLERAEELLKKAILDIETASVRLYIDQAASLIRTHYKIEEDVAAELVQGPQTLAAILLADTKAVLDKAKAEDNKFIGILEKAESSLEVALASEDFLDALDSVTNAVELIQLFNEVDEEIKSLLK